MVPSLRGGSLPESFDDFRTLQSAGELRFPSCWHCKADFGPANTHSLLGWRETQISGMCETCFDALFTDLDEFEEPPSIPADRHD